MYAALHGGYGNSCTLTKHQNAGVTNRSATGKFRNVGVWDTCSVGEFVGKSAKARAKHERDAWAQRAMRRDKLSGGIGDGELVECDHA